MRVERRSGTNTGANGSNAINNSVSLLVFVKEDIAVAAISNVKTYKYDHTDSGNWS